MSIIALTPIIATSLPLLTPIILAAAAALGYKAMVSMSDVGGDLNKALRQRIEESNNVVIKIEQAVLENMTLEVGREEALFFEKDGIELAVIKDERGKLRVSATGPKTMDEKLLEQRGQEFAQELAQMFAMNRVVKELGRMNTEVVEEQVMEDGEIRIKMRRWT